MSSNTLPPVLCHMCKGSAENHEPLCPGSFPCVCVGCAEVALVTGRWPDDAPLTVKAVVKDFVKNPLRFVKGAFEGWRVSLAMWCEQACQERYSLEHSRMIRDGLLRASPLVVAGLTAFLLVARVVVWLMNLGRSAVRTLVGRNENQ